MRLLLFFCLLYTVLNTSAFAKVNVVVSVLPQKKIVDAIGGDWVDVQLIVPAGQDPHTFEISPKQLSFFTHADFYWAVAAPFEKGLMSRIQDIYADLKVLDVRAVVEKKGHLEVALDPHVWLDPEISLAMARQLKEYLKSVDPLHQASYEKKYRLYAHKIEVLKQQLQRILKKSRGKAFLVFHPAWGYFAKAYGLRQIAIEREGKEAGAKYLGYLLNQVKQLSISIILIQPGQDSRLAQVIGDAVGIPIQLADPLSPHYFKELKRVATAIAGQ